MPATVGRLLASAIMIACVSPGAVLGTDPTHHELEVRLWPEQGRLEAVDRIEPAPAGAISFTLAPGLTLSAATVEGRPVPIAQDHGTWRIDAQVKPGQEIVLEYAGQLMRDPSAGPPFLGADGGFLPAGSGWMPTAGKGPVTFDLRLEVPQPFKAVATGALVSESEAQGIYRARFVAEHPGDEPSVFAGPYVVSAQEADGIELRTWFYPEQAALAPRYLRQAVRYLEHFANEIGDYPYRGFQIVAAPIPVGLGFPGLTYVARQILPLPFMQTQSLAHEILHSWWGNAVGVAYGEGNWAEGLTTYMADYGLAAAAGPEQARAMRLEWLRDFNALPPGRDMPLTSFAAKSHDAGQIIGYNKAAFVFHMLHRRLGEAGFRNAIRRFWREQRFAVASWSDLRRSFEETSGDDLGGFFQQWLHRPGAPRLGLKDVRSQKTTAGYEVKLTLTQDTPPYALQVPVAIETTRGRQAALVEMKGVSATVALRTAACPLAVTTDPDYDLFRRLAPGEAPPILRDVTLSPATLTVLAADSQRARALAGELAARMMDTSVQPAAADDPRLAAAPVLLIGLRADVADVLARAGLPKTPPEVALRGSARVWTARRANGPPLLVVEADDVAALQALLRPLPHYGRSSYLVFNRAEVASRGVWPTGDDALRAELHKDERAAPCGRARRDGKGSAPASAGPRVRRGCS